MNNSSSKHILHVVSIQFSISYFIGDQFLHFKDKGFKLYVICSPSPYIASYSEKMQFEYVEVEITRAITPLKDLKACFRICKYIKANKIDIVVGHSPKGALLSILSAWFMRVPNRIYFRHGLLYETSRGLKRFLLINMERLTALLATKIVCVSPSVFNCSLRDNLNKEYKQLVLGKGTCGGINSKRKFNRTFIIKNEVIKLQNRLGIAHDAVVIGFCGRLVRDKGIIDLVKAFDLVRGKYSDRKFILLLVGFFDDRDALPSDIVSKIMEDSSIICTGLINDSIENYYALMDMFILASYREGFGMCVLEASAMEVPILTTAVTGCVDSIIEDVTGRYIENNCISIAKGIEFYLDNPLVAKKYGQNGREFVINNFDQEIIWQEIEKLYD